MTRLAMCLAVALQTTGCASWRGAPRPGDETIEAQPCEPVTRDELVRRQWLPRRRAGRRYVPPTQDEFMAVMDATKQRGDKGRVTLTVVIWTCVDPAGRVVLAEVRQPSGLPDWDRRNVLSVKASSYCPFESALGPAPVCGTVIVKFSVW